MKKQSVVKIVFLLLLLIPYLLYVVFIIRINQGPVDYETFMSIGHRLLSGDPIYTKNSYYPLPFVMIFAFFSWLPRPLSMLIWFLAPVVLALVITNGNPFVLLFSPLFGHLVGGQSSVFAMLGFWGFRSNMDSQKALGGISLGLILLKPQLAIIPIAWAFLNWFDKYRKQKKIPLQAWAFVITSVILFLPGFLILPDWAWQWLKNPRPLFVRALSGIVPRFLFAMLSSTSATFWLILICTGSLLLAVIFIVNRGRISLDLAMLWGFVVNPLMHDYDLIQLIPMLDTPVMQIAAVLLSIPGWFVILFAYQNDASWAAFTVIAPGLLFLLLVIQRRKIPPDPNINH